MIAAPSFLLPLSLHHGSTTYRVEGWPALLAAVVCAGAGALLLGAGRRLLRDARWAYLGPPLALLACAGLVDAWIILRSGFSMGPLFFLGEGAQPVAAQTFFPILAVAHAAAVLAVGAVFAALAVAAREGRGALIGLGALLLGGAYPAHRQAAALETCGWAPRGVIDGQRHLHRGRSRAVVPRLEGGSGRCDESEFQVTASAERLTGERPGPLPVTVRATSDLLTLETEVRTQVVEPRAGVLFPLRDGAVLRFAGQEACTFDSGRTTRQPAGRAFTIKAAPERDGLEVFQVDYAGWKQFTAYGADGETYWLPGDGSPAPVVTWDRRKGRDCAVAPVSLKARCTADPEAISEIFLDAGTGTASKVVVGLLTLGMGVPEGSTCTGWLQAAGR